MLLQGPDPDLVAPVIVSIALIFSTAAVLIIRPLTKRIGDRLAASKQPTIVKADEAHLARLQAALEETNARVQQLEQRLDFTERLLAAPRSDPVPAAHDSAPPG